MSQLFDMGPEIIKNVEWQVGPVIVSSLFEPYLQNLCNGLIERYLIVNSYRIINFQEI